MLIDFDYEDILLIKNCISEFPNFKTSKTGHSAITRRLVDTLGFSINEPCDLDLAILLRQFLAHVDFWKKPQVEEIELPENFLAEFNDWEKIGIYLRVVNEKRFVRAVPWRPTWLPKLPDSLDQISSSEKSMRSFTKDIVTGDPFLKKFSYKNYRSVGQRSAVRSALSTPSGENLIINLPTGEGKSFIFQLIHVIGFADTIESKSRGLTLVVVPTVALGADLEAETRSILGIEGPLFYESGNDARTSHFIDQIKSGQNAIIFVSPEAITSKHSRLKSPILEAAENGTVKALVVDEAHLIEAWGIDFRDDFQTLGAFRERLINSSPENKALRTIFLSATIAPSAKSTLEMIFNNGKMIKSVDAGSLRVEPTFLKAVISDEEDQKKRVIESLCRVPRPCILYVSTVEDANFWYKEIKRLGFSRIGMIHGDTSNSKRKSTLSNWKDGKIDVMVGTSAFGIGINYNSVRSVIHACIPETLDRFYQEIGRGGRDGKRCLSLTIPKFRDLHVGERLANKTLIGADRGLHRWRTMFNSKKKIENNKNKRFFLKFDEPPGTNLDEIDMQSDLNTRWNLRVLNLLVRAKAIKIIGPPDKQANSELDASGYLEFEVLNDMHLNKNFWLKEVEPIRLKIWSEYQKNFKLMKVFLNNENCPAEQFAKLYGSTNIQKQCSSCVTCEIQGTRKYISKNRREPRSPWKLKADPFLERLIGGTNRLFLYLDESTKSQREIRRLFNVLKQLQKFGLNKFIQFGATELPIEKLTTLISDEVVFFEKLDRLVTSRLPFGAEVIFLDTSSKLQDQDLRDHQNLRIFIGSKSLIAPDGRKLIQVFNGRKLSMKRFIGEINA